jgi:hypothetical protein
MNSVFATCDACLRAETVSSTFKYGEHIQYINCSALNLRARTPGRGKLVQLRPLPLPAVTRI